MRKVFCVLCALILLSALPAAAIDGDTFNEQIAPNAGTSSAEWYVFTYRMQGDEIDYSLYNAYLDKALETKALSAVEIQRCALAKLAIGLSDGTTVDETAGKGGIMSYIFALHLLNNGATSELYTTDSLTQTIASMQLQSGGFALSGESGVTDVTAMAITALAPLGMTETIQKALTFLANTRQPSGGYKSYGCENCEATAMVLIALAATDSLGDERFAGLADILNQYAVSGGYSHTAGGAKNAMATVQAECAKAAITYAQCGKQVFVFDKTSPPRAVSLDESQETKSTSPSVKIIIIAIIAVCGLACVTALLLQKKRLKALTAIVLTLGLVIACCIVKIETPDEHFAVSEGTAVGTVTLSITCSAIGEQDVLEQTQTAIYKDDTVYDVLLRATKQRGIIIVGSSYISSIDNLAEMQYGAESGWMYSVNGSYPELACTDYKLKDGDTVEWKYVLKLFQ